MAELFSFEKLEKKELNKVSSREMALINTCKIYDDKEKRNICARGFIKGYFEAINDLKTFLETK